jgi:hypothetical protein
MADAETNLQAFAFQAEYCDANDAPITARLSRAIAASVDAATETGRRILDWPGGPIPDALPLRTAGGVHAVWRDGRAPELSGLFEGRDTDPERIAGAVRTTLEANDAEIATWLNGPPQTNEPGRSAGLMAGLLVLAERFGPRIELLEIGSSAGLNLLIDRYRFDLGGVTVGPADSPVLIRPEWRGTPPPAEDIAIESVRGVDIQPIDPTSPEAERRLLAYIWADHAIRFPRVSVAIDMIREKPVSLDRGDAADWVEALLAEPQEAGVTRVLMHSIVWQYIPAEGQARIEAAMQIAGARATEDRPLGWVSLEADRVMNRHDLTVRSWPGAGEKRMYAHAHAHGFWVEWLD